MSEQELNMMGDERGKDEASASAMLKKHETLEAAIADYSETVNELGDTAKALVESGHPESDTVKIRQAQVDKLYEGLKDLAEERRGKLDETLKLYQLQGEIDDLEQWIAEKEIVAGSQDIGQDLAQVEVHLLSKQGVVGKHFSVLFCFVFFFGSVEILLRLLVISWLQLSD